MRMGLFSSVGAQYGAALRVNHIVDPPPVGASPAHAIGGPSAPLLQAGVQLVAGATAADGLDGLVQRHEAPLPHALAHLVLLRTPPGAEGVTLPTWARTWRPTEGLRLHRNAAKRLPARAARSARSAAKGLRRGSARHRKTAAARPAA